jgi:queuine/archaeosine tRNA-ribosyltransferase
MEEIRTAIDEDRYAEFKRETIDNMQEYNRQKK